MGPVGVHKTMQAQMQRHEFLPMTASSPRLKRVEDPFPRRLLLHGDSNVIPETKVSSHYRGGNAWTAQFNHAFVDPKCGPQKRVVAVVCDQVDTVRLESILL